MTQAREVLEMVQAAWGLRPGGDDLFHWMGTGGRWTAPLDGGWLVVDIDQWPPPESEDPKSGESSETRASRHLSLQWQAPDPRHSTSLYICVCEDYHGCQRISRKLGLQRGGYDFLPVPTPSTQVVRTGPRLTRGYYSRRRGTVRQCLIEDGRLVRDLDQVSREVRFYLSRRTVELIGQASGVKSAVLDQPWSPSWMDHFPRLRQYHDCYQSRTWYRQPDDSWAEHMPPQRLRYLWVHTLSEMFLVNGTQMAIVPRHAMSLAMGRRLHEHYSCRYREDWCLLSRRARDATTQDSTTLRPAELLDPIHQLLDSELILDGPTVARWLGGQRSGHWEVEWEGGRLILGIDTLPAADADRRRCLDLYWEAPRPEESTHLRIQAWVDSDDERVEVCRSLSQAPDRIWLPVATPDSVVVDQGPSCTRGYYATRDARLSECILDRVGDLDQLPSCVYYYNDHLPPSRGQAPSVQSLWAARETDTPHAAVVHYPNLCQWYRSGHPSLYRQPDGSWDTDPPEEVSCLWVHTLDEIPYLRRARQILVARDILPSGLAVALSRDYQYQYWHRRGWYLLTRRPRAKSAHTTRQT